MQNNNIVTGIVNMNEFTSLKANKDDIYIVTKIEEFDKKKRVISTHCGMLKFDGIKWNNEPRVNVPTFLYARNNDMTVIYYNDIMWNDKFWGICQKCNKIVERRMIDMTKDFFGSNCDNLCVHCKFAEHYKDHALNLKIGLYIKKFEKTHIMSQCNNPDRCFICDYKNHKLMLDIIDKDILYGDNLLDYMAQSSFEIVV